MGSAAYWAIGSFKTHHPRLLSPEQIAAEESIVDTSDVRGGVEYYDAYLKDNDSRFVFSFVRSAMDVGATAANYVEVVEAELHTLLVALELGQRVRGALDGIGVLGGPEEGHESFSPCPWAALTIDLAHQEQG